MKKGFSLLEVIISISILAVLVLLASLTFLNLGPKYRLKKTAWEINSRLNYLRYKAIFEGTSFRMKFSPKSYAIEKYDESSKKWQLEEKCVLEGASIEANNNPTFHPEGTVSNLASILISNSWGRYRISIAITGRIKSVML